MVALTVDYIERRYSQARLSKSLSRKMKKMELYNFTQLRMNNMYISSIGDFAVYKNLKVIYLQNNNISRIENLQFALNLTHLYLQHNMISKLENLDCCMKLETLYLGYNKIAVIEGLDNLRNLTVLHIENQRLTRGETLSFDPRSVDALSNSVKILNISGNKISSLQDIRSLRKLEVLDARNNAIDDIHDLSETVRALISLKDLSLQDNPVTQKYRFRENLIANNDTISTLNGITVTDVCRCFMRRFQIKKHLRCTNKRSSDIRLDEEITSSLNLSPALRKSITKAMFRNSVPRLSVSVSSIIGETQPRTFPFWNTATAVKPTRHDRIVPRPFWSRVARNKEPCVENSLVKSKSLKLPQI